MTQQQMVKEFRSYPKAKKSIVIRQLLRIFEEDLEEESGNGKVLSIEERKAIVERLRGIAAVEGRTPPTDEEVKEDFFNYLSEKHR